MLEGLLSGFGNVFTIDHLLLLFGGVMVGVIVGCIPGLNGLMAITLCIPLTYVMDLNTALIFLLGIYNGGIYGGSISAILLGTPGAACATCTVLDGFPMALKGQSGKALKMALFASVQGCITSCLVLIFFARPVSRLALYFGPDEYTLLVLMALTMVGAVAGESMIKGLLAAVLGIWLSTIGMDPLAAISRYSLGNTYLMNGLQRTAVFFGLLTMPMILNQIEKIAHQKPGEQRTSLLPPPASKADTRVSFKEWLSALPTMIRGSLIGVVFGALPALGATPAAFFSYQVASQHSKHKEQFGKGCLQGVAASESANNGTVGATFVPLLAFGIPGDSDTAMLLTAFMIKGISMGPTLFTQHQDTVYTIYTALISSNLVLLVAMLLMLRFFNKISKAPQSVIFPCVLMACCIGIYAMRQNITDVFVMIIFAVIGYVLKLMDFPSAPAILGMLLGGTFERSIRQSLLISKNSLSIFFSSAIDWIFWAIIVVVIVSVILSRRKKNVKPVVNTEGE